MPNWLSRLTGGQGARPAETKAAPVHHLVRIDSLSPAEWTAAGLGGLGQAGFARNPVVYRCVRMVAEAANRVPFRIEEGGRRLAEHPALALLRRPNARQSGSEMLEMVYAHLMVAGNAYLDAAIIDGAVKGLHVLRPDRVKVIAGPDGWITGYEHTAGGRTTRLRQDSLPIARVLHMSLMNPLDDHYGLSPLDAARQAIDLHNASANWNKALLDNSARPSGALVYTTGGHLTQEQFERLKSELEDGFSGSRNAGRPMVLEGGLEWRAMALSPRDMDFIEARNGAARDIALAFGVPPMLLGIPGDNTYANLVEASRGLWRQTIIPLVRRVADDLSFWLAPAFGEGIEIIPDFDAVEALAEDRAQLWRRVSEAGFLTDAEKRAMLGVGE
ncbi:phage portal protein, HK97 family [Devosia enhydra]|uniref:Phage portal protein, HK97 family n=1 Tax=Devosia enhydra TaxID=665118 RepID=A0A1K2I0I8_9HYPH|nr:phage portal protein [Devosia enhydra]SFZ85886.1 phage portal protein, HK97 family [Devosia enhydra]